MARTKKSNEGYGIGAVARITGLTDHTIRVWERRYKAVVAKRTESGRRLYSAANVEKLGLLKQLTDKGIAIGKIATKSNAALRKVALEYEQVATKSLPDTVRIAVFGDLVSSQLVADPGPLEVVVADDRAETFRSDLENQPVDVIVLETAVLDDDALAQLQSYLSLGRARCGLVIYSFGQKRFVDRAIQAGNLALRSPVSVPEVQATIQNLLAGTRVSKPEHSKQAPRSTDSNWQFSGTFPSRRFSQQQLTKLVNISTAIDCECPQNLARLVAELTAFEIYSAQCSNRDTEDAALHHYLHQTTASARELIEIALAKVVEAEEISL
jgi:DNA-binding transcriptional MerR regulator